MIKGLKFNKGQSIAWAFIIFILVVFILIDGYNFLKFFYIPPFLSLAVLYFWCIHGHGEPPYFIVFLCGLLLDLLSGAYLGQNALIFVLVQYLATHKKATLRSSFRIEWTAFGLLLIGIAITENTILYSIHQQTLQLWEILFGLCMTFFAYPLIYKMLQHIWLMQGK